MIQSKLLPEISVRMYHPAFYKGFNAKLKANAISLLTCHPANDISEPFVEFKF
jgi:energy-converting hydrogenase Eha subunit G